MDAENLNPIEKQRLESLEKVWGTRAMIVATLLPAVPFWSVWWQLRSALGPEGLAGVVVVTQLAFMGMAPQVGYAIAKRQFRRVRPNLPKFVSPTREPAPKDLVIKVKGFTIVTRSGWPFARVDSGLSVIEAEQSDIAKLRDITFCFISGDHEPEELAALVERARRLFCFAVSNHRRERELFRNEPASEIALRILLRLHDEVEAKKQKMP